MLDRGRPRGAGSSRASLPSARGDALADPRGAAARELPGTPRQDFSCATRAGGCVKPRPQPLRQRRAEPAAAGGGVRWRGLASFGAGSQRGGFCTIFGGGGSARGLGGFGASSARGLGSLGALAARGLGGFRDRDRGLPGLPAGGRSRGDAGGIWPLRLRSDARRFRSPADDSGCTGFMFCTGDGSRSFLK